MRAYNLQEIDIDNSVTINALPCQIVKSLALNIDFVVKPVNNHINDHDIWIIKQRLNEKPAVKLRNKSSSITIKYLQMYNLGG